MMNLDTRLSRLEDIVWKRYLGISFYPKTLQIERLCHCDANEACYLHQQSCALNHSKRQLLWTYLHFQQNMHCPFVFL